MPQTGSCSARRSSSTCARSSSSTRSTAKTPRAGEVMNEIFNLFIELGANDEAGRFTGSTQRPRPALRSTISETRATRSNAFRNDREANSPEAPAEDGRSRWLISRDRTTTNTSDASASAACSAARSRSTRRSPRSPPTGRSRTGLRLTKLLTFRGLERIEVEEATAGDIVCVSASRASTSATRSLMRSTGRHYRRCGRRTDRRDVLHGQQFAVRRPRGQTAHVAPDSRPPDARTRIERPLLRVADTGQRGYVRSVAAAASCISRF